MATAMIAIMFIVFFAGFLLGATGAALHYQEQNNSSLSVAYRGTSYATRCCKPCAHIEPHFRHLFRKRSS